MVMSMPSSEAALFAPFCIATKNGLVESLVISDTAILSPPPDEPASLVPEPLLPPHAARASMPAATTPTSRKAGVPFVRRIIDMSSRLGLVSGRSLDNVVWAVVVLCLHPRQEPDPKKKRTR